MEHRGSLAKDLAEDFAEDFAKCLYRGTLMFPESVFWYKRTALQLRISFLPVMNQKSTHPF